MNAACPRCKSVFSFHHYRGFKLKDAACPRCKGGGMKLVAFAGHAPDGVTCLFKYLPDCGDRLMFWPKTEIEGQHETLL